jgi:hypothetical protein
LSHNSPEFLRQFFATEPYRGQQITAMCPRHQRGQKRELAGCPRTFLFSPCRSKHIFFAALLPASHPGGNFEQSESSNSKYCGDLMCSHRFFTYQRSYLESSDRYRPLGPPRKAMRHRRKGCKLAPFLLFSCRDRKEGRQFPKQLPSTGIA